MKRLGGLILLYLFLTPIVYAQMIGTYTIGGTSPDYNTVADAQSAMNSLGVSGPITFLIRPGTYSSTTKFLGYYSYTITYKGETGIADDVHINTTEVIASQIEIKHITIHPIINTASLWSYKGIEVRGFDILMDSCVLQGPSDNSFYNNGISVLHSGGNISITNMEVYDLDVGIGFSWYGWSGNNHHYGFNSIENCTFDSVSTAIRIEGAITNSPTEQMLVSGNVITNSDAWGIFVNGEDGMYYLHVRDNHLYNNTGKGIEMRDCSLSGTAVWVYNNMLSGYQASSSVVADQIYLKDCNYIALLNNSMYGGINLNDATNIDVYNNSLYSANTTLLKMNSGSTYNGDYNNFFALNAPVLIDYISGNFSDLASFQQVSAEDLNSISEFPYYFSDTDLHSYSPHMQFAGNPLPEVTSDIDAEIRDAITPDIGADEFQDSPLFPFAWFEDICAGSLIVTFPNMSVRDSTSFWDFGDGNTSNNTSPTHTYVNPGVYDVLLIVTNPYGVDSIQVSVTVNNLAETILFDGTTLSISAGYADYQWNYNGNPISGAVSNTYVPFFDGLYTVTYTDNIGCVYTTSFYNVNVGVEEHQSRLEAKVYPNPATTLIQVELPKVFQLKKAQYVLYDQLGQQVTSGVFKAGNHTQTISLEQLSNGFYHLSVWNDSYAAHSTVVKQ
jgi:PKD repeat protein